MIMLKKYLDIRYCCERILAGLLLVILFPLLMIISGFVCLFVGWPILFKQERTGYKEKSFLFYKFRSMNQLKDRNGQLLPDKQRLTAFGSFLRKTSLDELPQLFNILKGEMSFIFRGTETSSRQLLSRKWSIGCQTGVISPTISASAQ